MAIFTNVTTVRVDYARKKLRNGVFALWEFGVTDAKNNNYTWTDTNENLHGISTPGLLAISTYIGNYLTGVGAHAGVEEEATVKNADSRIEYTELNNIVPFTQPTDNITGDASVDEVDLSTSTADARFTFSGAATVNSEIELISTDGTQRTYQAKASVSNGTVDGTDTDGQPQILFDRGSSATESATNLAEAIHHANGHTLAKIRVTASSGRVLLSQMVPGAAGNKPITLDVLSGTDFTTATNPNPPAAFINGSD